MIDQATMLRNLVIEKEEEVNIQKPKITSKVISVSSGKGGVGKSSFVANFAIALKRLGKEVIIVDADLGFANIEVLFDVFPKKTLKNVIFDGEEINSIIAEGPLGIKFLSGGSGIKEITKISRLEQERLINGFAYLDEKFDYILVDTGAGVSDLIFNFIKASDESIVVCTPEPTSITDAYALIKVISEYVRSNSKNLRVVVNRVSGNEEGDLVFKKIQVATEKFLDIHLDCYGYLPEDENVIKSIKAQNPICISSPDSKYAKAMVNIAKSVCNIPDTVEAVESKKNFFSRLVKVFSK